MTSIQVDIFDHWGKPHKQSHGVDPRLYKVYYDLVELTRPNQIKAIVKVAAILSRGIYDSKLPKPLEDQLTKYQRKNFTNFFGI